MLNYLRLYRMDVAILSIISYLIGVLIAAKNISYIDIIISFLKLNALYDYTLNSTCE